MERREITMTGSGDAAEQVVRLSLEGFEVAAKLTGSAAKEVALLLASVLKQEVTQSNKTRGKARLTSMIKSGKELKVFSIQQKDLPMFTKHAKEYGVLYCVLRDKSTNDPEAEIDIIARAEDASKIQRIVDRFELGKVDKASIIAEAEKDIAEREEVEKDIPTKSLGERVVEEAMGTPVQKERNAQENPTAAKTEKSPPSEQSSERAGTPTDKGAAKTAGKKPSVREKLNGYKAAAAKQKEAERTQPEAEKPKAQQKPSQTVHQQPKPKKKKTKER
ncbi:MAG: PcfB family protein [Muribaculaceae bacterium]|nr:PcfB family protein [Muribaculaceae bacterium]